ncbi:MAG: hypothetical protein GKR96_06160 [Gammaproteobacteria bacterium]|nr:hypothetical protein [Gammaproteobacteria bacterium]
MSKLLMWNKNKETGIENTFTVTKSYISALAEPTLSMDCLSTETELLSHIMAMDSTKNRLALLEMLEYEKLLEAVSKIPVEDAVAVEMLQLFSDEQWPELLFEFQGSFRKTSMEFDTVRLHEKKDKRAFYVPSVPSPADWIVFNQTDCVMVRKITAEESLVIDAIQEGKNIGHISKLMVLEVDDQKLTKLIAGWLDEGLIIDVGVPMPDDSTYD